ncbi:hypothetical protein PMIN03_000341 [Paraphaeosphaeria minitans]
MAAITHTSVLCRQASTTDHGPWPVRVHPLLMSREILAAPSPPMSGSASQVRPFTNQAQAFSNGTQRSVSKQFMIGMIWEGKGAMRLVENVADGRGGKTATSGISGRELIEDTK